jgi:microcystin-dependent protein
MDLTTGQILLKALDFAPTGTLACNGQRVSSASQPALFETIGTVYGGDRTNFAVPNLPPVAVANGPPLAWAIVAQGAPYASGMEALLGEVRLFPAAPPAGSTLAQTWLPCDGRSISPSGNEALFALLGIQFGGNGTTGFALPKLTPVPSGAAPALGYWICTQGIFPPLGGDSRTPLPSDYFYDTYMGVVLQLPYAAPLPDTIQSLALCLGQTLSIPQWATLFSVLGTRYGGNGTTSFVLPSRATGADQVAYALVDSGLYPPRS